MYDSWHKKGQGAEFSPRDTQWLVKASQKRAAEREQKAQQGQGGPHHGPIDPKKLREAMVRRLREQTGISDENVLRAMESVPRHEFVQEVFRMQAYEDRPLPIGFGQTISQPSTVALMTQLLRVEKGMRVLEIGTGSGYQASILSHLGCIVYTVERIPELYEATRQLFARKLPMRNIYMRRDDGTLGMQEAAPFDRILVTAGGPEIPKPLVRQLDEGGIMLIPVGDQKRSQRLMQVRREKGTVLVKDVGGAVFVDLIGDHGW